MKKIINAGFTLVEVTVAVTIFSIIMISVFAGFTIASDVNNKTEINRAMQNNIKTSLEVISEDIRLNNIALEYVDKNGVTQNSGKHKINGNDNFDDEHEIFYTKSNEYFLGTKDSSGDWTFNPDCYGEINRVTESSEKTYFSCSLLKNDGIDILPITNSWVDFTDLKFYVTNKTDGTSGRPKVMINFTVRPSFKKGVKSAIIKENTIKLQTTINSEYILNDDWSANT